ncbi:melanoma-associated antigen D2-like [Asbolus verrucosus]|uniref:Melanoma-associated antigen D2-like n=1 Tax=Asbolus verrucosus TaxID=1661398 RepID=A0A482VWE2_ASBVE|nr:melanoma-associated antigen D2-like [Asbolus verrucosus]
MPRRTQRGSQSQSSSSQANNKSQRSSKSQANVELTQTTLDANFAFSQNNNFDDLVNNCVRFFVYNAGHNMYFRKADIQKNVTPRAGQQFQQIIEKAADILKNVYGYNLLVCNQTEKSSKAYIISNSMPYMNYSLNREEPETKDFRKILLLLILSHIYMSHIPITEASLYAFLTCFKIDVNKRHPLFGQVKDYIMNVLVKKKYLLMETDSLSKKISFSWGIRAEKEVSKLEILKFVCKIYKTHQPKSWSNQFRVATEQGFENDRYIEQNGMDVDEE